MWNGQTVFWLMGAGFAIGTLIGLLVGYSVGFDFGWYACDLKKEADDEV